VLSYLCLCFAEKCFKKSIVTGDRVISKCNNLARRVYWLDTNVVAEYDDFHKNLWKRHRKRDLYSNIGDFLFSVAKRMY